MKSTFLTFISLALLTIWSSTATAQCDYPPGDITLVSTGGQTSSTYTTSYVLVDASGDISQISASSTFTSVALGTYTVYAINYKNLTPPPVADFAVGKPWSAISTWAALPASCADISAALAISVGDLNDLAVSDVTVCSDETTGQTITITNADPGVTYEIQPLGGGASIASATNGGTVADLDITFPGGSLPAATTSYDVVAILSGCTSLTMTDKAIITVNDAPTADAPAPVTACDTYTLPALTVGDYYTATGGPGGTGSLVASGTAITTTTTLFVYAANGTCTDENSFTITIDVTPTADAPAPVTACDTYTLPALTVGDYYTATGGPGGTGSLVASGTAITTTTTLFVYAANGTCTDENSFTITIDVTPTADTPAPVTACDTYTLPALTVGDYYTATGGPGGTGSLVASGTAITTTTTLFVYAANGTCTDENSFTITIDVTPTADTPAPVTACDTYTLPALTVGDYYTATGGPGGTGSLVASGTAITTTTTLFVYAANGTCTDENSFTITIDVTPTADAPAPVTACDTYTLPALTVGDYYTATGGPGGTGSLVASGTAITTTTTLFVYAANGTCTDENSFTITIDVTPTADTPAPVTACDTYTLPALTVGDYYTATGGPGGTGSLVASGTAITTTTTLFVYAANGTCTDENSFTITIDVTPTADAPAPVTACDTYTLPALTVGDYYTATGGPGGTGSLVASGTAITTTTTLFVYAANGTCTDENSFTITIDVTPTADAPAPVTACDTYTLPALTVGDYYTATGGPGGTGSLVASGAAITTTTTLFVYAANGTCTDENSFTITIDVTPTADAPAPVTACDTYTLPALTVGDYYTATGGPGGTGSLVASGTAITTTTTLFVYAANGTCTDENSFVVTITTTPTPDNPAAVVNCGPYTLPALTVGDYYDATGGPGGSGSLITAGTDVAASTTLFVYAAAGTCSAENSFNITIDTEPVANAGADISECDDLAVYDISVLKGDVVTSGGTVVWTTSGTGTFSGDEYTATAADITGSTVTLTVTVTGTAGSCTGVDFTDSFILTFTECCNAAAPVITKF